MADIGKPLKRYKVIPLSEPVPDTREPQQLPAPVKEPQEQPQREPV